MSRLILPRRLRGGPCLIKPQRGFIINPYVFASSAPVYAGWDNSALPTNVTLSGTSNRTATESGGSSVSRLVTSAAGKNSGLWYFEMQALQSFVSTLALGFYNAPGGLGGFLGGSTSGWSLWDGYGGASDQRAYYNNAFTGYVDSFSYIAGARIGFAVNFTTGKIWFRYNGTWQGDPVLGTGNSWSFTPGLTLQPAIDMFRDSVVTIYTNPVDHISGAPSGYTAGWPN